MQCIVVKSDEFENSLPLYIFPLNPDYVAARSLQSLRSNKTNKELNEINLKEIKDHKSDQSDFYCTSPTALSSEVMAKLFYSSAWRLPS